MIDRQLELGFENEPGLKSGLRNRRRSSRANWWFDRMRGEVNHAHDWPASPPEEPRSNAVQANSGAPPSVTAFRTLRPGTPADAADPESAPESPRWRFGSGRRPNGE